MGQNISAPSGIRMMISGPTDRLFTTITSRVYYVCHNNCYHPSSGVTQGCREKHWNAKCAVAKTLPAVTVNFICFSVYYK